MERKEEELTREEQVLFDQLKKSQEPPKGLEQQIIRQLKNEGLMTTTTTTIGRPTYWLAAASIALIAFFAGLLYGRSQADATAIDPTSGFILLLHEPEGFQPGDPMEMFEEYGNWMYQTQDRGVTITGQELSDAARYVTRETVSESSDGKIFPTTGYFILEATSLEEAIAVAQENPHIKYGGEIEVKPFQVR